MTFVSDEYPVAVGNEIDEIETLDCLAVRPATRKISRAINSVIKRAGEVEVRPRSVLNGRKIFCNVGFVSPRAMATILSDLPIFFFVIIVRLV
jgi:hypothetical protein